MYSVKNSHAPRLNRGPVWCINRRCRMFKCRVEHKADFFFFRSIGFQHKRLFSPHLRVVIPTMLCRFLPRQTVTLTHPVWIPQLEWLHVHPGNRPRITHSHRHSLNWLFNTVAPYRYKRVFLFPLLFFLLNLFINFIILFLLLCLIFSELELVNGL